MVHLVHFLCHPEVSQFLLTTQSCGMAAMLSVGAGMLPAAPLPIPSFREGIGKTHEETEFKLYPRDTQTPRTFLFAL